MDEIKDGITESLTTLLRVVTRPSLHNKVSAFDALDAIERCVHDNAELLFDAEFHLHWLWKYAVVASDRQGPSAKQGTEVAQAMPLVEVLKLLVPIMERSTSNNDAELMKHGVHVLRAFLHPCIITGASQPQLQCLYSFVQRLLRSLFAWKRHTEVQAECVYVLLALIRCGSLQHHDPRELAELCVDIVNHFKYSGLRLQSASMQLLGCLCEQEQSATVFLPITPVILQCFVCVAKRLMEQLEVKQVTGEGLLLGLNGCLSNFGLKSAMEDEPAHLTLLNGIVLNALILPNTSTNYQFCKAALVLMQQHTSTVLAPFVISHAPHYIDALKVLCAHRHRPLRRLSQAAARSFWTSFVEQVSSRKARAADNATPYREACQLLQLIVLQLRNHLVTAKFREVTFPLSALAQLAPLIQQRLGPTTLCHLSDMVADQVVALLSSDCAFEGLNNLLMHAGDYLSALAATTFEISLAPPQQHAVLWQLLCFVLVYYAHSHFYSREAAAVGTLEALTVLYCHRHYPNCAILSLFSIGSLNIITSGGTVKEISQDTQTYCTAHLWRRLLQPSVAVATTAPGRALGTQQHLRWELQQVCIDQCQWFKLSMATALANGLQASLDPLVKEGHDDEVPRTSEYGTAFLHFVTFVTELSGDLWVVPNDLPCRMELYLAWVELLVSCARQYPYVPGYYALLHSTVSAQLMMSQDKESGVVRLQQPESLQLSHLLLHFLRVECARWMYMYQDELLYECAMCVLVGVLLECRGDRSTEEQHCVASGGPAAATLPGDSNYTGALQRAFHIVLAKGASSPPLRCSVAASHFLSATITERNEKLALRVLDTLLDNSPQWTNAMLPNLMVSLGFAKGHRSRTAQHLRALDERLGIATHLLEESEVWREADEGSLQMPLCLFGAALQLPLGPLIPIICELSTSAVEAITRMTAAKLVCWYTWRIINDGLVEWYSSVFPTVVLLVAKSAVSAPLHQLLLLGAQQLGKSHVPYCTSRPFVEALLRTTSNPDASPRQLASEIILTWLIPQDIAHTTAMAVTVIDRVHQMWANLNASLRPSSIWTRLGATSFLRHLLQRVAANDLILPPALVINMLQSLLVCMDRCTSSTVEDAVESVVLVEATHAVGLLSQHFSEGSDTLVEWVPEQQAAGTVVDLLDAVCPALQRVAVIHPDGATALIDALQAYSNRFSVSSVYVAEYLASKVSIHCVNGGIVCVTEAAALVTVLHRLGTLQTKSPQMISNILRIVHSLVIELTYTSLPIPSSPLAWFSCLLQEVPDDIESPALLLTLWDPAFLTRIIRHLFDPPNLLLFEPESGPRRRVPIIISAADKTLPSYLHAPIAVLQSLLRFTSSTELSHCPLAKLEQAVIQQVPRYLCKGDFSVDHVLQQYHSSPVSVYAALVALAALANLWDWSLPSTPGGPTPWDRVASRLHLSPRSLTEVLNHLLASTSGTTTTPIIPVAHLEELCASLLLLALQNSTCDAGPHCCFFQHEHLSTTDLYNAGHTTDCADVLSSLWVEKTFYDTDAVCRTTLSLWDRSWRRCICRLSTNALAHHVPCWMAVLTSSSPAKGRWLVGWLGTWVEELRRRTPARDVVLAILPSFVEMIHWLITDVAGTAAALDSGDVGGQTIVWVEPLVVSFLSLLAVVWNKDGGAMENLLVRLVCRHCWPVNPCAILSSSEATHRVVVGFRLLRAILQSTELATREVVQAAKHSLMETMHKALPLRWSELTQPQEKVNYAAVARACSSLMAVLLAFDPSAIESIMTILSDVAQPHWAEIVALTHAALEGLPTDDQRLDVYRCAAAVVRDARVQPGVAWGVLQHVLLPVVQLCASHSQVQLFKEEIAQWICDAGGRGSGNLSAQTAALTMIAEMYRLTPLSVLRGSISDALVAVSGTSTSERLLIREVTRVCLSVWSCPPTLPSRNGEVPYGLRPALRCLVESFTSTKQHECVFIQCFWSPRSIASWNMLLPTEKATSSELSAVRRDASRIDYAQREELQMILHQCHLLSLVDHMASHFTSQESSQAPEWVRQWCDFLRHPHLNSSGRLLFLELLLARHELLKQFVEACLPALADAIICSSSQQQQYSLTPTLRDALRIAVAWVAHCTVLSLSCTTAAVMTAARLARWLFFAISQSHREGGSGAVVGDDDDGALISEKKLFHDLVRLLPSGTNDVVSLEDMKTILSDAGNDVTSCLQLCTTLFSSGHYCIGRLANVESNATAMYDQLLRILDAAAPVSQVAAAALLGVEYREVAAPESLLSTDVCHCLQRYLSCGVCRVVTRQRECPRVMLYELLALSAGSSALLEEVLEVTSPLQHFDLYDTTLQVLMLEVVATVPSFAAVHLDTLDVLFSGRLQNYSPVVCTSLYSLLYSLIPRVSVDALDRLPSGLLSEAALAVVRKCEATRVAYFKAAVAVLHRYWELGREQGAFHTSVVRNGLRDSLPTVYRSVVSYLRECGAVETTGVWQSIVRCCCFHGEGGVREAAVIALMQLPAVHLGATSPSCYTVQRTATVANQIDDDAFQDAWQFEAPRGATPHQHLSSWLPNPGVKGTDLYAVTTSTTVTKDRKRSRGTLSDGTLTAVSESIKPQMSYREVPARSLAACLLQTVKNTGRDGDEEKWKVPSTPSSAPLSDADLCAWLLQRRCCSAEVGTVSNAQRNFQGGEKLGTNEFFTTSLQILCLHNDRVAAYILSGLLRSAIDSAPSEELRQDCATILHQGLIHIFLAAQRGSCAISGPTLYVVREILRVFHRHWRSVSCVPFHTMLREATTQIWTTVESDVSAVDTVVGRITEEAALLQLE